MGTRSLTLLRMDAKAPGPKEVRFEWANIGRASSSLSGLGKKSPVSRVGGLDQPFEGSI